MKIIHDIFIKRFYRNGYNLCAILFKDINREVDNEFYFVQCGHKTYRYVRYNNALKRYLNYLSDELLFADIYSLTSCTLLQIYLDSFAKDDPLIAGFN